MDLKMIPCPRCGDDFPELRKTQYGYDFCVNCSTVDTKRGMSVTYGSGDHTWTETIIMDQSTYNKQLSDFKQDLNDDEYIVELGIE
jgi:hypothetical protein